VAVNVEMKHDVPSLTLLARATEKAIREAKADVLLSSFDPVSLPSWERSRRPSRALF